MQYIKVYILATRQKDIETIKTIRAQYKCYELNKNRWLGEDRTALVRRRVVFEEGICEWRHK